MQQYLSDENSKTYGQFVKIRQEKFIEYTRVATVNSWGQLSFVCYGNGKSALARRFNFSAICTTYAHAAQPEK